MMKVSTTLRNEVLEKKLISYFVQWHSTPNVVAQAMAHRAIAVAYVEDGEEGEPCQKTMDHRSPDHYVDFGNDVLWA